MTVGSFHGFAKKVIFVLYLPVKPQFVRAQPYFCISYIKESFQRNSRKSGVLVYPKKQLLYVFKNSTCFVKTKSWNAIPSRMAVVARLQLSRRAEFIWIPYFARTPLRRPWAPFGCPWAHLGCAWAPLGLSLIHIWRCRRSTLCRSRWSPYH